MTAGAEAWRPDEPRKIQVEISVWTGFKFGLGLALGGVIVGIVATFASLGLLASFIDALSRTFR